MVKPVLTLYHTIPTSYGPDKETSIFSFSHNVFNPIKDKKYDFKVRPV